MCVAPVECEHWTRIESEQRLYRSPSPDNNKSADGKTHRLVLSEIDINIRELLPCYELTGRAIDCLARKLERPFVLALTSQKVTLYVE